MTAFILADRT